MKLLQKFDTAFLSHSVYSTRRWILARNMALFVLTKSNLAVTANCVTLLYVNFVKYHRNCCGVLI